MVFESIMKPMLCFSNFKIQKYLLFSFKYKNQKYFLFGVILEVVNSFF